MIVVCLSMRALEFTKGQWKGFDLEIQDTVFLALDRKKLQLGKLCECQLRHQLQAQTLAP